MSAASTPSSASASSSRSSSISSSSAPGTPPNMHQNTIDPAAKWLVQKYGGTSVGKFATKIAEDIIPEYLDQHKVAIVCSARSGSTKALGTTNLLLRAAGEALKRSSSISETPGTMSPTNVLTTRLTQYQSPFTSPGKSSPKSESIALSLGMTSITEAPASFNATVDVIRSEHVHAARSCIRNADILKDLEAEIDRDCESLRSFLFATQIIDEISPRSRDSIIGFGERLGCKVMTAILRDKNIDAEFVSLENVIPIAESENFSDSDTLGQEFYDRVAELVAERIKQCGNRVPVVTGFFGPVPGSLLRQVGRGYTDLLAALLAAGLGASELQIWKEVDGIFTADPRKVPTARLIPIISPEEAAELTYYGSEVVHPFTMDQVIRRRIPIRIKNVENPTGGGTVIHPDHDVDAHALPNGADGFPPVIPTMSNSKAFLPLTSPTFDKHHQVRQPTAVTIKEHIIVLNVNSNRKNVSHGFLASIFGTLDRYGVVVDLISTSEVYVSMAIEENLDKKVLDRVVRELKKIGTVSVSRDMAILSLVGKSMRNMIGISGRMFTTLGQGNVNIEMISQGANEINISCVIDGRDAVKALNLIHQSCLQIKPEGERGRVGPWLF
ncbi:aspartate kinase [Lentinus tigrinus ALCF2SS1-7]|uniref:aspartate kinase n=1 Tax=Lentinus tigrinus ALCF2SS1-6 TaxID=1328759 RepID=A0A5C2S109_9APHY|nr:aspartate kinase [Lentinus tigrinus ALCF2SS1-6]RPD71708.1 aspartate kinase [Lentinus tigrinus ALCF2SS1-7]